MNDEGSIFDLPEQRPDAQFPILSELAPMTEEVREERAKKGRSLHLLTTDVEERADLTEDEREALLGEFQTDDSDTQDIFRAAMGAKFIEQIDNISPFGSVEVGEPLTFGVHWLTDKYTGKVLLTVFGRQVVEYGYQSFQMLLFAEDKFALTDQQIKVLERCADRKAYPSVR